MKNFSYGNRNSMSYLNDMIEKLANEVLNKIELKIQINTIINIY